MDEDFAKIIENISIDCTIFGFDDGRLKLLLVKHGDGVSKGQWALPGGFVEQFEDVDDSAHRILYATTGIKNTYLDQLKIFGKVDRYPFRRVITMAYFALARPDKYQIIPGFTADDAKWVDIEEVPQLIFDHNEILDYAVEHLKTKVRYEPIGFNLLPKEFTLDQFQQLYEVVLERKLDRQKFKKEIFGLGILKSLVLNEPADFQEDDTYVFDEEGYQRILNKGSIFDFNS